MEPISLQNLGREGAFSEGDVRLLSTLAGSLSVALENARLFEETRQRNAELGLINSVQRGLAEKLETQAMYDLVGDRPSDGGSVPFFEGRSAVITLLAHDQSGRRGKVRIPSRPLRSFGTQGGCSV